MFTPARVCVFVYVSCQAMPGMRRNADLILPFTSICLQKSAGEREMHAPNTTAPSLYSLKSVSLVST